MPINIDVKIDGLNEIQDGLKRLSDANKTKFGDAMYEAAGVLASAVRASQRTPVATGFMINKTGYQRQGMMGAAMYVGAKYAAIVHQGIDHDIELAKPINVFIPGYGWRHLKKIKARAPKPFVDWALEDGAQVRIDAIVSKCLDDIIASV